MHPIERLRWIARADGESATELATQAAWALGALAATEPAALLTACRRLLERHPACGPLYWTAARLLAADDPLTAASAVAKELCADRTAEHLVAELGATLASGSNIATSEPVGVLSEALETRGRYGVRFVGALSSTGCTVRVLAALEGAVVGFALDECEAALDDSAVAVVETLAAGPGVALLTPGAAALVHGAAAAGVPAWLCVAAGRCLPAPLAALAARSSLEAGAAEMLVADEFALAIGRDGSGDPAAVVSRTTCRGGTELAGRHCQEGSRWALRLRLGG